MPKNPCAASVKSRIKGHHVYNYPNTIGEEITCFRERRNNFSDNALVVKKVMNNKESCKKKTKTKKSAEVIVDHVPESLSKVLTPLMDTWAVVRVVAVIDAEHRRAPEDTWTSGGGIEIPCTYKIYTAKVHKKLYVQKSEQLRICNVGL